MRETMATSSALLDQLMLSTTPFMARLVDSLCLFLWKRERLLFPDSGVREVVDAWQFLQGE
jgi:hypothetical protein